VSEFDEAEDFTNARLDFVGVDTVFVKAVGHVFADGERVEESAFLEDEADLAANTEEFGFGDSGNVMAENADVARIGTKEAGSEFKEKRFAGAGFAEEDYGFALLGGGGDAAENFAFGKTEVNIIEFNGRLADCLKSCCQAAGGETHEGSEEFIRKIESDLGEEGVGDNDEYGGNDNSLRGGAANTLGSPFDIQALIATDRGDQESEDDSFHEALHDVREFENFDGAFPESGGVDAQGENAGDHAAKETDEHGDGSKERNGDERSEDAGSDELAARVGAHGAHGVYLFGDHHGAEAGRATAGDEKAGDGRAEFADEGEGNDVAGE
jgi:hypothetical protein